MTEAAAPFTYPDAPIRAARALPVQPPSHIYGRDSVLADSHRLLNANRAVLLSGAQGSSRAKVAAVLAAAQLALAEGRVLWLTVTQPELNTLDVLLSRTARAYGSIISIDQPQADRINTVRDLLNRNKPLIILDGAIDVDIVRTFIQQVASGLPVIAIGSPDAISTTNQAVPARSAADPLTSIAFEPLADSARLDILRAYGYQQGEGDPASLGELAALIGGNPLALELAARYLGTQQRGADDLILALYGTIDDIGADGEALAIARMLAVVYPDLIPIAKGVCLILGAVFTGSASAELLTYLTQLTPAQIGRVMGILAQAGLVYVGISAGNDQPQYTMHPAIRDYMREQLRTSDKLTQIEDRTVQAIEAYVAQHAHPNPADHDRLAVEMPNIVGAAAYAVESGDTVPVRALLRDLETNAGDFVTARGFQPELQYMRGLIAPPVSQATPAAPPADQPIESSQPALPVETQSPALEPTIADAAAHLPLPADSELQAVASDAQPSIEAAAPVAQLTPVYAPPPHMPEFDSYLDKRAVLSNPPPAEPVPAPADSTVTQPVSPVALDTASLSAQSDRSTPQGLQACIDDARNRNDQPALADCALRLGDLYMNAQDTTSAIGNYQIAITALRTGSDQDTTALALERLGHAQLIDGEPADAAQALESAVELLGSDAKTIDRARVLTALGSTYDLLQEWPAAQRTHQHAAIDSRQINDQAQEAIQWGGLARAHQAQGHTADAIDSYRKGLHVAYVLHDGDLIANYGTQLGALLITDGKTLNQAVSLLSEAMSRHPENIDTMRMLKRGQRWIDQAHSNKVVLPDALDNPAYARLAYTTPVR